jgi:hypothetical protein
VEKSPTSRKLTVRSAAADHAPGQRMPPVRRVLPGPASVPALVHHLPVRKRG